MVPCAHTVVVYVDGGMGSLVGFKRGSRDGFLAEYRGFVCAVRGCYVCGAGEGRGEGYNVGADGGERGEE